MVQLSLPTCALSMPLSSLSSTPSSNFFQWSSMLPFTYGLLLSSSLDTSVLSKGPVMRLLPDLPRAS